MAITRSKTGRLEAGIWRQWGEYWRTKTAEQNIDTRLHRAEDALQLAPFTAAVLVLAKTVASAEWIVERINGDGKWEKVTTEPHLPAWLDPHKRPNPWQTASDFRKQISLSLNVFGNSVVVASDRKWRGEWPNQMTAYPWWAVDVALGDTQLDQQKRIKQIRDGDPVPVIPGYGDHPKGITYTLDGNKTGRPLTAFDPKGNIIHIRYATLNDVVFGYSPLQWAEPPIRTAIAADAYSELGFLYGMLGPGFLVHQGKPGDNLIESMRKYMTAVMRNPQNRHAPMLISGEWNLINTQSSSSDLQMMEQRKLAFALASAVFGVPRALLGDPDASLSGTGIYHLQRAYAVLHAHDHLNTIAGALSEALPRGYRVRIVPSHLLALEPAEQSRVFERLIKVGVMKPSEARAELGLPPIEGLDEEVCPLVVGGGPETGAATPTPGKTPERWTRRPPTWTNRRLR